MNAAPDSPRQKRIAAERQLLAALCQGSPGGKAREELVTRLATHKFETPDHEAVFGALRKLGALGPARIREALAAAVTRMGFPDADVNPFFEMAAPAEEAVPELLKDLQP